MRIGILSDIHADLPALAQALDLLRAQAVDRIVCAGDLVDRGPDGEAVVCRMREEALPCIQGNHDAEAAITQGWLRRNADLDHPRVQPRLLSEDSLAWLAALPPSMNFTWVEQRVLLAHGTPWSAHDYVFPRTPPQVLRFVAECAGADVVILGHTHLPMRAWVDGVMIVNPGSVTGAAPRDSHTCGVLSLPDAGFEVYDLHTRAPVAVAEVRI
jgi:putative phosphoesterase